MTPLFRIVLILGALATFVFVLTRIRKSQMKIADCTFWFLFALGLVILAIFPQIAFWLSWVLGIESPANVVFLAVFVALILNSFRTSADLSQLRNRFNLLVQEKALSDARYREAVRAGSLAGPVADDGSSSPADTAQIRSAALQAKRSGAKEGAGAPGVDGHGR